VPTFQLATRKRTQIRVLFAASSAYPLALQNQSGKRLIGAVGEKVVY
jgi:hypothetical protein